MDVRKDKEIHYSEGADHGVICSLGHSGSVLRVCQVFMIEKYVFFEKKNTYYLQKIANSVFFLFFL